MSKCPLHFGQRMLGARNSSRARSRQLGHTPYLGPQVAGSRPPAPGGRATTVQRVGAASTIWSDGRGTAVGRPLMSSTASTGVSRTTRYHAPWRSFAAVSGRTRAHCIMDTIVPPRSRAATTSANGVARSQLGVAGACRNRTYRAPFGAQTVLKTARATRPDTFPLGFLGTLPPPGPLMYPFIGTPAVVAGG